MSDSARKSPDVLLVTRNLPPLRGGMERLNFHLAKALGDWGNLTVVGAEGCRAFMPDSVTVIEVPATPLRRFLLASMRAAQHAAKKKHIDLVVAGSGLTAPAAFMAARRANAKSVAYVHGLDLLTSHPLYRLFWKPVLRRLDLAIANSRNTADIARRLGVARGRIEIVHPGVTMPKPVTTAVNDFRAQHRIGARPLLLSVGRLTKRKGLDRFIRESLPAIVQQHPQVLLLVIGDEAPHALTGSNIGGREVLTSIAVELGLVNNLRFLGPCNDEDLSAAYFAADVHVFPVREIPGDVEGFGIVAIEAAAHGLPTVAFAVGGVPDAVAPGRSGWLISPGDYSALSERINKLLAERPDNKLAAQAQDFAAEFEWSCFSRQTVTTLAQCLKPPEKATQAHHGHAVLDLKSRIAKARKIEKLIDLEARTKPIRMLEVGTGSGGIAHYFGSLSAVQCDMEAVDVTDTRQICDGYRFSLVDDVTLPFPDRHFDVVISNHVIEHVGDLQSQRTHLSEIRRVLKPDGMGYLAVPNRWQWIEPHYQLAGLSWLPERWRTHYLRLRKRGEHYDCRPLTAKDAEWLFHQAGFSFQQQHGRALRLTYELERPNALIYRLLFSQIPDWAYAVLARAFPTLIYVLRPLH